MVRAKELKASDLRHAQSHRFQVAAPRSTRCIELCYLLRQVNLCVRGHRDVPQWCALTVGVGQSVVVHQQAFCRRSLKERRERKRRA